MSKNVLSYFDLSTNSPDEYLKNYINTSIEKSKSNGFIPDNSDVRELSYGIWTVSSSWEPKGIKNLPNTEYAKNAGVLEVIPFAYKLKMLRWTVASLNTTTKPNQWICFQGYKSWGPWNIVTPEPPVKSVATLKGDISTSELVSAISSDIEPIIEKAVSKVAIDSASGEIQILDNRYRVEDDGTNNVVFGRDSARLRKYPDVRNNTSVGLRSLYNLTKGRYNDFFGGEAGYYLDGAGFSESEGKASRNAGFGTNTQRFNKTGMNNVTMGRNAMQCNVSGVNNTYIGAGSAQGIAHMRLSDGVIENQLPLDVWGNAALGTATHRYGMGNQNTAVGGYALSEIKLGDGNVAVGASSLGNLGKDAGYNGKRKVDVSKNPEWSNIRFSISNEKLVFTAPNDHEISDGYMLQCKIDNFETQFWYVSKVSGNSIELSVGMSGYSKSGTMQVLEYYTNDYANNNDGNIAIGRRAGTLMDNGEPAYNVKNSIAIGEDSAFIGDNTITLGNSKQTVHTYKPIETRSDARDKTNVQSYENGLDFIKNLKPYTYNLSPRDSNHVDEKTRIGFIAQDLLKLCEDNGIDIVSNTNDVLSISYTELIPIIVSAIKEINNKLDNYIS